MNIEPKLPTIKGGINTYPSKKGLAIVIRLQYSRDKKTEIKTGEYIEHKEDFDSKSGYVKNKKRVDHARINAIIDQKKVEIREQLLAELEEKEKAEEIEAATKPEDIDEVLTEFNRLITNLEKEGKENSRRLFFNVKNHIIDVLNTTNKPHKLRLEDINDIFLDDFRIHLTAKGLAISTIKSYMDKITTVFSNCNKRRPHLILNPIKEYKKKVRNQDKSLSFEDNLFDTFKGYIPKSKERTLYKNWNVFQYYSQGTRISDIITISYENIYFTDRYVSQKDQDETKGLLPRNINVNLKFNAIKTGTEHDMTLCEEAILTLRFFLHPDLQHEYLKSLKQVINKGDFELEYLLGLQERPEDANIKPFKGKEKADRVHLLIEFIQMQKNYTPKKCIFHDVYLEGKTHGEIRKLINNKTTCVSKCQKCNEEDEENYMTEEHLSTHSFRHLFSINYYNSTRDIYSLSKLLGHTNIGTTERYLKRLKVEFIEQNIEDFYSKN
ncbi:phage integrase family protein [Ancylomarina subtilis]|uniref:Phage integrase family protein n=1 Tax=Ancylomarina subtilis TaxID=1639035 RepID=A0A4Q7VK59_9BACT|nr:tyrosine-type recombinase/integrase [Ancylomarina subtilis]RZT96610.1 phage integrase family protein [Ancylomarina subtilis]